MTQPTHPQPTYPPAPQPEPKKKGGWLKWIPLGILLVLASCGVIVTAANSPDTATQPTSAGAGQAADPDELDSDEPETFAIGEKATDDDYQFTVTKIKCGVSRIGDSYLNEKAQGQFCLVTMKVKNVGDEAINFSSDNQALFDTKGKEYSPDDGAWLYLEDAGILDEINPGNSIKTTVPFDLPKKAKPDHLLLKAGIWGASDGVKVML